VALPNERLEDPDAAPELTLNVTLATPPFDIEVWFRPKMMTRMRPVDGDDQESVFPAEEAEDPMLIFWTVKRLASKVRSKFNPVTPIPSSEWIETGMLMPASPAIPEELPTDRLAPPPCA
jgi:hypothetical protein